jgi:hypothetical protein
MADTYLLQQIFQLVLTITATICGISFLVYIVIGNMLQFAGLQGQLESQNDMIARCADEARTQGWNACKDVCKDTCLGVLRGLGEL